MVMIVGMQHLEQESDGNLFAKNPFNGCWYRIARRGDDGYGWEHGYGADRTDPSSVSSETYPTFHEALDAMNAHLELQDASYHARQAKQYADAHGLELEALAVGASR